MANLPWARVVMVAASELMTGRRVNSAVVKRLAELSNAALTGEGLSPLRVVGWDTNGDGLADVAASQAQPTGSTPVPFNGFGRVQLRFDPNIRLPNGIMLPLQYDALPAPYREGRL